MDGTPTAVVIDMDRDEDEILNWLGLPDLIDGERQWFDLAARPLEDDQELPMAQGAHVQGACTQPRLACLVHRSAYTLGWHRHSCGKEHRQECLCHQ